MGKYIERRLVKKELKVLFERYCLVKGEIYRLEEFSNPDLSQIDELINLRCDLIIIKAQMDTLDKILEGN